MINEDELKKWLLAVDNCALDDAEAVRKCHELFERLQDLVCFLRGLKEFVNSKVKTKA